jgi:prepilin-type N-terminal cleavage/methylation domain-containing protein
MLRRTGKSNQGFTLIELLAVCGIAAVLAAITVPRAMTSMYNLRLRSGAVSAAGVLQNARMTAIQRNRTVNVHFDTTSGIVVYVDLNSNGSRDAGEPAAVMNGSPSMTYTPSGTGAPSTLTNSQLSFDPTATPTTADPSFNSRGLPSNTSGTMIGGGNVYYFSDARPWGRPGWSAISISQSGRIKVWTWTGTAWK